MFRWIRRSDHPSRPNAMTCCFFSSFKTLLTLTEGIALASKSMSGTLLIVGRFSGDHVWPVLGVHRGTLAPLLAGELQPAKPTRAKENSPRRKPCGTCRESE